MPQTLFQIITTFSKSIAQLFFNTFPKDLVVFPVKTLSHQPKPFCPSAPARANPPLKHGHSPKYHVKVQFLHNFANFQNFLKAHPYVLIVKPGYRNLLRRAFMVFF